MKSTFHLSTINYSRRHFLRNTALLGAGLWCGNVRQACADDNSIDLNIKNLGAIGDGIVDDSDVIDNALQKLATYGGVLHFPDGTYRVTRQLSYLLAKDAILRGDNAVLKFDGNIGGNYCINFFGQKNLCPSPQKDIIKGTNVLNGDFGDSTLLLIEENNYCFTQLKLALSKRDDFTFQLTSQSNFFNSSQVGKSLINDIDGLTFFIISILDSTNAVVVPGNNQTSTPDFNKYSQWAIANLWCPSRGYYTKGELMPTQKDTNGYKCANNIYDTYKQDFSKLSNIVSGKLQLTGLTINGTGQSYGLKLCNLFNVQLQNITICNFLVNSLHVKESSNVEINNSLFTVNTSNYNSNYAACVHSSQNINISNCKFSGGTHALSHGGTFPCRNIQIHNSSFSNSSSWALDFHGNCQNVSINAITSNGGGYIGGIDININNSVFNNSSLKQGTLVLGSERDCNYYQLKNNTINNQQGAAVVIANQFLISSIDEISIDGNIIKAQTNCILLQAYPYGNNPTIHHFNLGTNDMSAPVVLLNINNHNKFII